MASVPKGLRSIPALLKRFKKAQETWELWRSLHQEAFDFANPERQTFTQRAQGQPKNRHVFDDTAVDGLEVFASRIESGVTPSWQNFFNYTAGKKIPKDEQDRTNQELADVTDTFFENLNHSNFDTEISQSYNDLGIGTGAIIIEEGDFAQGEVFKFSNVPLSECFPEATSGGPIKNVWRQQDMVIRDIQTTWPKAEMPPALANKAKKDPEAKEKILNGFLFNTTDNLYHQVVIHEPSKTLMFTQSFETRRLIAFRWHVTPGETFGRGPIIKKLPTIRTANKIKQFMLENAAIQIAGVYTGVDDGIFNPHTMRIAPGVVMPVASNAPQNASLAAITPSGNIGLGDALLEKEQDSIRKALFADPFGEINDPVRTATEQLLRKQDMLEQHGASFGRLKSELIEPLAAAGLEILAKLGQVADVRVDGETITLKQTSPLAVAEDQDDFNNFQIWYSFNAASLPPELLAATVKLEEIPRWTQKKLGVPAELLRTEDETAQVADTVTKAAVAGIEGGALQGGGQVEQE